MARPIRLRHGSMSVLLSRFLYLGLELSQAGTGPKQIWLGGAWKRAKKPGTCYCAALSWTLVNHLLGVEAWSWTLIASSARAEKSRLLVCSAIYCGRVSTEACWISRKMGVRATQDQEDRLNTLVRNQFSKRASVYVALSPFCFPQHSNF